MEVVLKPIQKADIFVSDPIFKIVSEEAQELGIPVYVVGGYVRDRLLKKPSKDVDFTCVGDAHELARRVAKRLPGKPKVAIYKRFRTASITHDDWQLEFVGARKESYSPDSRNPHVEAGTLEDDLKRRDFTINALIISLNPEDYGILYDPFTGIEDLKNKIIRTPLDPEQTFFDDPLRMLRAIRFATQLNFRIDDKVLEAISKMKDRIKIVSPERISDELNKILLAPRPSIGFKLLDKTGLLEIILPELTALKGVEERDGFRHKDNFKHTLKVLDNIAKLTSDLWLRWAALLHDIGKVKTKAFDPKEGWTFHGHDAVGAKMVPKIFKRLHLPLDSRMKKVKKLVALHQRPIALTQEHVTDSGIRRIINDAGEHLEDLLTLCRADITSSRPEKVKRYLKNFDKLEQRIKEVEERDRIRNFQPPISGEIIMKVFDIPPSKPIGIIKKAIKDAILDGEIRNDFIEAFEYMIKKGQELGLTPKYTLAEFIQLAKQKAEESNAEQNKSDDK